MIKFATRDSFQNRSYVTYCLAENSFSSSPLVNSDIGILIGYVNIGIDSETMLVKQVWGYSSKAVWKEKKLKTPDFTPTGVLVCGNLLPGMTYRYDNAGDWDTQFDPESGWICIGNIEVEDFDTAVEFMRNGGFVISNGSLKSIWLKPDFTC